MTARATDQVGNLNRKMTASILHCRRHSATMWVAARLLIAIW